eukprot:scaffold73008_cov28-Tisochrysis_lutea.AAC.2
MVDLVTTSISGRKTLWQASSRSTLRGGIDEATLTVGRVRQPTSPCAGAPSVRAMLHCYCTQHATPQHTSIGMFYLET